MDDDWDTAPQGLLRCLEVLAEEAAFMRLTETCAALHEAIATCREESEGRAAYHVASAAAGLVH
jgi:hypothetical protein